MGQAATVIADGPGERKISLSPGPSPGIGKKGAETGPGKLAGDHAGDAESDGEGVTLDNILDGFTL